MSTSQRKLTKAEAWHLLYALGAYSANGSYYGCKKHFIKREKRLRKWLEDIIFKQERADAV